MRPFDGAETEDGSQCSTSLDSTIYISMSDPLGNPAFKPSPTKPIPRWMQYLPEHREIYRPQETYDPSRRSTSAATSLQSNAKSRASSGMSSRVVYPSKSANTPPTLTPRSSSKTPSNSISSPAGGDLPDPACAPLDIRPSRQQPVSWVSHEPLKRPSSRLAIRRVRDPSETEASSAYGTPPEFTVEETAHRSQLANCRSPSPRWRGALGEYRAPYRPRSPLSVPAVVTRGQKQHQHDAVRPTVRTPPPLSSEYLEKYQPIRSPSPRPAAVFREPMAMIEAMRRESLTTNSSGSTIMEPDPVPGPSRRKREETLQPSVIQDAVRAQGGQLRRVSPMGLRQAEHAPNDGADSIRSAAVVAQGPRSPRRTRHLQVELKKLFGRN